MKKWVAWMREQNLKRRELCSAFDGATSLLVSECEPPQVHECDSSYVTYGSRSVRSWSVIWDDGKTGSPDMADGFVCSASVLKSALIRQPECVDVSRVSSLDFTPRKPQMVSQISAGPDGISGLKSG